MDHRPRELNPYPMRLQKFLARGGAASRRGSEDLMTAGRVTVNGEVVSELGSKVDPLTDEVRVDGKLVSLSDQGEYLMMHKPSGYLTTMLDPQGRPTVQELLPSERAAGLFPVGRLDYDTSGLLLFMTDGELAHKLLHPKGHVTKRYLATVDGILTEEDAAELRAGVMLHDGMTKPAEVEILKVEQRDGATVRCDKGTVCLSHLQCDKQTVPLSHQDAKLNNNHLKQFKKLNTNERIKLAAGELPVITTEVSITISEGRKRQVKRMFAHVGRPVLTLHRAAFGPLELGELEPGECRKLTSEEINALKEATLTSEEINALKEATLTSE